MKATGGCLCGHIRSELNSYSFIGVSCHDRDCQHVFAWRTGAGSRGSL